MKILFIYLLKLYKMLISPVLPKSCRFYPSCSSYAVEALEQYGAGKGSLLALRRVLKCHPFHPGGYDPVNPVRKEGDFSSLRDKSGHFLP